MVWSGPLLLLGMAVLVGFLVRVARLLARTAHWGAFPLSSLVSRGWWLSGADGGGGAGRALAQVSVKRMEVRGRARAARREEERGGGAVANGAGGGGDGEDGAGARRRRGGAAAAS